MDTEIRVVDPESNPEKMSEERKSLPDGTAGLVLGRGPQVMKGYYKNVEATNKAIDKWGWFDTGDLGRINPVTGDLILTGRAKDTIVLSNGENIEPQPIEGEYAGLYLHADWELRRDFRLTNGMRVLFLTTLQLYCPLTLNINTETDAILSESDLIEQVMLSGQDGRSLIAIAVINPNELLNSGLLDEARAKSILKDYEMVNDPKCTEEDCTDACMRLEAASKEIRSDQKLKAQVEADVKRATSSGAFRKWEQVSDVYLTLEPFAMANGLLTQSYKVKRDFVAKRYAEELPSK